MGWKGPSESPATDRLDNSRRGGASENADRRSSPRARRLNGRGLRAARGNADGAHADRSSADPQARSHGDSPRGLPQPARRTWPWRWCPAENIRLREEYAQIHPEGKRNHRKRKESNPGAARKVIYFVIPSEARNLSPI